MNRNSINTITAFNVEYKYLEDFEYIEIADIAKDYSNNIFKYYFSLCFENKHNRYYLIRNNIYIFITSDKVYRIINTNNKDFRSSTLLYYK